MRWTRAEFLWVRWELGRVSAGGRQKRLAKPRCLPRSSARRNPSYPWRLSIQALSQAEDAWNGPKLWWPSSYSSTTLKSCFLCSQAKSQHPREAEQEIWYPSHLCYWPGRQTQGTEHWAWMRLISIVGQGKNIILLARNIQRWKNGYFSQCKAANRGHSPSPRRQVGISLVWDPHTKLSGTPWVSVPLRPQRRGQCPTPWRDRPSHHGEVGSRDAWISAEHLYGQLLPTCPSFPELSIQDLPSQRENRQVVTSRKGAALELRGRQHRAVRGWRGGCIQARSASASPSPGCSCLACALCPVPLSGTLTICVFIYQQYILNCIFMAQCTFHSWKLMNMPFS